MRIHGLLPHEAQGIYLYFLLQWHINICKVGVILQAFGFFNFPNVEEEPQA